MLLESSPRTNACNVFEPPSCARRVVSARPFSVVAIRLNERPEPRSSTRQ